MKQSNNPECFYGHIYRDRKALEITRNDSGHFAPQAQREANKPGRDTGKWAWNNACYPAGTTAATLALPVEKREPYLKSVRGAPGSGIPMLHLGHINDRAKRYAVKLFLAHFHAEWFRREFGREPPLPYPIAHLNHAHVIAPKAP